MNILLRAAKIIDPNSPFHLQTAAIFVKDGIIASIGQPVSESADQEVALDGLCVSPGWVDPFAHFCDPGFEHKETLASGAEAAAAGGYTRVLVLPNTAPFLHTKSSIEYIVQNSRLLPVTLHPIGGITRNGEGKELAEMYDMHRAGSVAFSDGLGPVQRAGLLLKALQYVKAIEGILIQLPEDRTISPNGLMHEGVTSTYLGLPGKPALAEELAIARDIELVKYTGSKIHFTGISTARSVALIAAAKNEGWPVTCSVAPYHLYFTDADVKTYDTNLKVNPPLRPAADRDALCKAVEDGIIDCIASHHLPQNIDDKLVEFEYAQWGMTGLQTAFALVKKALPGLPVEKIVALFSNNARVIFGLPMATIQQGQQAEMTLFTERAPWTFTKAHNRSRSANTPLFDISFQGGALGIIHKDKLFLNQ